MEIIETGWCMYCEEKIEVWDVDPTRPLHAELWHGIFREQCATVEHVATLELEREQTRLV